MATVPADPLALCIRVYDAASALDRERCRWVMSRPWYDQLRAQACLPEQEKARAMAHREVLLSIPPPVLLRCPACRAGPFAGLQELVDHVIAMGDPANREPDEGDWLLGIPLTVRPDGGEPHLERL